MGQAVVREPPQKAAEKFTLAGYEAAKKLLARWEERVGAARQLVDLWENTIEENGAMIAGQTVTAIEVVSDQECLLSFERKAKRAKDRSPEEKP